MQWQIKTLLRAYNSLKDHTSRSGNYRKTYHYEKELDELFGGRPNVTPVCTISSSDHEYATEVQGEDLEEFPREADNRRYDESAKDEKQSR